MFVNVGTEEERRGERCSIRRAARDQLVTNNLLVLLDDDDMNGGNTCVRLLFGSSSVFFFYFLASRDVFHAIDRENREKGHQFGSETQCRPEPSGKSRRGTECMVRLSRDLWALMINDYLIRRR